MTPPATVPVALFAYDRPGHLQRTLAGLEANRVPLIYAFSDGPRKPAHAPSVQSVREILRSITWCEVVRCEREDNFGLGRSILAGVASVLAQHDAILVFEDDLVCVPGTYAYLCAALHHYRDRSEVTSIAAWNHPRLTPADVRDRPYFSGRGEIWGWGTWPRAWRDMDRSARWLLEACRRRGIDTYRYGSDLHLFAEIESERNLWAVRFIFSQMLQRGLCLCPPCSMVDNIGFDAAATNTSQDGGWSLPEPPACPSIPDPWPAPVEHPEVPELYRRACGEKPGLISLWSGRTRRSLGRIARSMGIRSAR